MAAVALAVKIVSAGVEPSQRGDPPAGALEQVGGLDGQRVHAAVDRGARSV